MGRLVQEKIKQPLAEELLFGKLIHGGEVKVTIKDDAPAFEIVAAAAQAEKKKRQEDSRAGRRTGPARGAGVTPRLPARREGPGVGAPPERSLPTETRPALTALPVFGEGNSLGCSP